jgi:hypothetical protein
MTDHPITPPPELVQQWVSLACEYEGNETWIDLATEAARWGSDQELEACCSWLLLEGWHPSHPNKLRAARRPKPPSLKKQALIELGDVYNRNKIDDTTYDTIRCALEMLPE